MQGISVPELYMKFLDISIFDGIDSGTGGLLAAWTCLSFHPMLGWLECKHQLSIVIGICLHFTELPINHLVDAEIDFFLLNSTFCFASNLIRLTRIIFCFYSYLQLLAAAESFTASCEIYEKNSWISRYSLFL